MNRLNVTCLAVDNELGKPLKLKIKYGRQQLYSSKPSTGVYSIGLHFCFITTEPSKVFLTSTHFSEQLHVRCKKMIEAVVGND